PRPYTLALHDALPIYHHVAGLVLDPEGGPRGERVVEEPALGQLEREPVASVMRTPFFSLLSGGVSFLTRDSAPTNSGHASASAADRKSTRLNSSHEWS